MKILFKILILNLIFTTALSAQAKEERGVANFYHDKYQGRKTASGDLYDKAKFTAAHKTLPFGTIVKVTRLDNKKSVQVKINDRGPYLKGVIIDLSRSAAEKLDLITIGEAHVKIEVLNRKTVKEEPKRKAKKTPAEFSNEDVAIVPPTTNATANNSTPKEKAKTAPKKAPKKVNKKPTAKKEVAAATTKAKAVKTSSKLVVEKDYQSYDLYEVAIRRPSKQGFGVQVASLTNYENVFKQIAVLQGKWFTNILLSVEKGNGESPIYKIILGPFEDEKAAQNYKSNLKKKNKMDGFVVDLATINYN